MWIYLGVVNMENDYKKLCKELARHVEDLSLLLGTFMPNHTLLAKSRDLKHKYKEVFNHDSRAEKKPEKSD